MPHARPRAHVYVFMRKRRLFCSFPPSVHTQTLIQRFRKTGLKVETFENAALSCGRAKTETFENGVDLKTHTCGGRGLRKSISELIWLPSLKMFGWSERQAFKNLPNLLRHSEMAKYGYATFCLVGYTIYPTAGETDKLKIKSLVWVCSPVAIIVLLLWFSHPMRCAMDHTLKTESSPRKLTLAHRNVICCDCVSG